MFLFYWLHKINVYGKPVIPSNGGLQFLMQDSSYLEQTGVLDGDQVDQGNNMAPASSSVDGQEVERVPRPLSPTKLLPFLSNSHRLQSDADLEALRKRLHHAPRPLKKRGSITESEGPGGPNIQKLLYQKTTLAAMETTITPATFFQTEGEDGCRPVADESTRPPEGHCDTTIPECEKEEEDLPNDEGITALHNAVCAGHAEIVKFLVQFGVNANAADSDGWTPLHCAASCNNVQVCKFLVESGAAVYATTYSDMQTAADKCEEMEEGYAQCSQFLYGVQEKMGIMNRGIVYALWDYDAESPDELSFKEGDCLTILRREDREETEWWWARCADNEGYIPRNLLGMHISEAVSSMYSKVKEE
uniref:Apoptosis-stimulating of p53 protein 2-like n=1 Tax=Sinocyclocheilus grahami TaxID=75366 RepID=A0A672SDI5_SINGR